MSGLKKNWFYGLVEHCRDHICISVATLNSVRIEACALQRRWKCRGGSVLSALDRLSPPLLEQGTETCSEGERMRHLGEADDEVAWQLRWALFTKKLGCH